MTRLRIERATKLLASSTDKTDAIAVQCGYPNPNSFWLAFRQTSGLSPERVSEKIPAVTVMQDEIVDADLGKLRPTARSFFKPVCRKLGGNSGGGPLR